MLFRESLVVNAKALTRNHFEAFISNGGSAAIAGAPPFANRSTQLTEESFFIKFPKETDSIRQKQTSGAKSCVWANWTLASTNHLQRSTVRADFTGSEGSQQILACFENEVFAHRDRESYISLLGIDIPSE